MNASWFRMAAVGLLVGAVVVLAQEPAKRGGQERIDFEKARQLLQKTKSGEKLTDEEQSYLDKAKAARRAQAGKARPAAGDQQRAIFGKETTGFKPLTEMGADDKYLDQDGGLYGKGKNEPPQEHRQAAEAALAKIKPLDAAGKAAKDGKIVFVSISMSNATQEFSTFKRIADADQAKSPLVTIVDCAQGGQAMAEWAPRDAQPWTVAMERLEKAGVTPKQVQVAWIKLANKGPRGELHDHGDKLKADTLAAIHNARQKFPNLRIAYLGSRIYGGYTNGGLNPEPYAYETAFVCRWLIQDQIDGGKELNYDTSRGDVKAPLLLWGPYFWGDGTTPRKSDGLVWKRDDLGPDGTHPSNSGREKVAGMLLEFCKTDPLASPWFVGTAGR
ncbi:MAG TPA: hypothetical protein VFB96_19635 [Pirellulaceae bacterium]|nr:hypothetical protein [Pirellulaceae bacterium]